MARVHGTLPRALRTGQGSFALDIRRWTESAKERADVVVQKVSIDLLSTVIQMSPVGNPELWAANAGAIHARETHNLFAERINALSGDPKKIRRAGRKKLATMYPMRAGKGYVGGRFRGNWQVSIGGRPVGETGRIDPNGSATLAAGTAVATTAKAGDTIHIVNNVPYALKLEWGWSKQAPQGMVGITVARFQFIVNAAVIEAKAQVP